MPDAMVAARESKAASGTTQQVDVAVVGAGFAGLYLLHRLRKSGLTAVALEEAGDVGGTWYWNRYPGARCDIQTIDYSYTFDPELDNAWTWSEKYATQPEILRYLGFVADRHDLRRDIRFKTKVTEAKWDEAAERWQLTTSSGTPVSCRHYIMATGCLSAPKPPEIDGVKDFEGKVYFTGRWPHDGVDLAGKRVAVIGTGSSAIQSIPLIAEQAAHLTVFQRTPNFALPAHNGPSPSDRMDIFQSDRAAYREQARQSMTGVPYPQQTVVSWQLSDAERRERFERAWAAGDLVHILTQLWADQAVDVDGNKIVQDLIREKIRATVNDPETAAALTPHDHPFGAKRPCLDTNYYATYNRPNVTLVNLRQEPIKAITASGITTAKRSVDVDVIVFATGFDAMTGAIRAVHPITGRGGKSLTDVWAQGPQTYLGVTVEGFPNFFMITGPGSPSVLSNMAVSIEQHVDWVVDRIAALRDAGFTTIEPTEAAQAGWGRHMTDCSMVTLHRLANTWYTGANVPGKVQGLMPYTGGVGPYRSICDEVTARGMLGFKLTGPNGAAQCNDGEVVCLQPDVRLVLNLLASLNLPPIESMGALGARAFVNEFNKGRPAGRLIGEIVDGTLPGADGPLPYRIYKPATPGPHPVVVYFHGGGWVLGDEQSDEPLCRDLVRRTGMMFVSVGYRHAPEHRFPTAAEDGYAATRWIAEHATELGGRPGPVLVAGWSAGGNIAAVTCQLARDRGGPEIAGQLLVCPVTDCTFDRPSYNDNATGYFLTRSLMYWFWDLYCSPADRTDPRVSPLRGNVAGLPPALVVTCEFDPLRDEGIAYAEAMAAVGVPVEQLRARGHFHSSFAMVDVVITGVAGRVQMAEALRRFAGLPPEVSRGDEDSHDHTSPGHRIAAAAS
ncbi:cation diffusion facilitator CzcD-associated flavoprotein CzcO/acetyl esterase/lipase [Bradyrhizobium japonicum]|uniref:flavin-containing monooxygenase n=2 Tax=Nitrobacteraceae TaxID=41294 RepID=UPI00041B802A|nr:MULTISPECIES: alpha/beta hydrolase fold domain-containing protein [Bradyrhizobium]MBR0996671.1 alpha/beta hydrolase fold domain-containing protein [Bradyrhizobium liaoningense]MBR1062806.1 alpha/beta hydrolase fold domain-containing protein [Bradyrhizobium liaoningense]MCP1744370.1 cation diffusion facilitator CzcD-associated flavoprotein CzcO/acetyl esterase/lipase [Bradyrhizobium japonicum]MCP1782652.1 cation diffusion facilitator CzcD-associated flavoprotein CzcO/acetyl esterase/lipase [B